MSCYFRICYICVILVLLWLLPLVGLCRHFYCYLKSTPSGEPSAQTPVQGVTSGFSLKSCSPGPRRLTTINKPFLKLSNSWSMFTSSLPFSMHVSIVWNRTLPVWAVPKHGLYRGRLQVLVHRWPQGVPASVHSGPCVSVLHFCKTEFLK